MGKNNKIAWYDLVRRFKSPTPQFWKAVRTKMLTLSIALGALGVGLQDIEGFKPWVYEIAKYIIRIGAIIPLVIAFVASFTVKNDPVE